MSTVNFTGFEGGDVGEATSIFGTASIQNSITAGAWSAYALRTNPTTSNRGSYRFDGHGASGAKGLLDLATVYTRFRFRCDLLPGTGREMIFTTVTTDSVTLKALVTITSAGVLQLRNKNATVVATGSAVISTGVWYLIEVQVGTGTSATLEVKVDGTVDATATTDLTTTNNGRVIFGKDSNSSSESVDFYYDDCLVSDSAYPGPGQCSLLKPNANGNYQTWFPFNLGDHYVEVDEVPHDSDTTYLFSPDSVDAETNALQSGADVGIGATDVVNCVKNIGVFKRNLLSNGAVTLRIRSGSTDNDTASNYATTASYALIAKLYDTDPATAAAWATAALDSLESGSVNQDATNTSRLTSSGVMVDYSPAAAAAALYNDSVIRSQAIHRSNFY